MISNSHEKPHVHVSMTSISQRMDTIARTVFSLIEQDYDNYSVSLYLSREPYLLDKGIVGSLPEALQALEDAFENFSIRFTQIIGPYRKIIPKLAEEWGTRRLIATADDDTVYPADWLSRMVEHYQSYQCVICYRGHTIAFIDEKFAPYRQWMVNKTTENPSLHIVPTGKDGILYDTDFFHPRVIDFNMAMTLVPTTDDLWLKWHTAAMRVPCFSINTDYTTQTFENFDPSDSLYLSFNKGGQNDTSIKKLEDYAKGELNFSLEASY